MVVMNHKRACIIANTPAWNESCALARVSEADLVIVTDGAAHRLPRHVVPQVVCGDFDSIDLATAQARFPGAEFVGSSCQETNDLEKCIALAIARGATEIALSCCMGGRMDQTVTTLSLIERYHGEIPIVLHEFDQTCRVVSGRPADETELRLMVREGDTISLVPRGDGAVVSLTNVCWPLARETLTCGSRGVSNKSTGTEVILTVHQGVVFLFHAPGDGR
jgi:thiamine pyrophosphokinase